MSMNDWTMMRRLDVVKHLIAITDITAFAGIADPMDPLMDIITANLDIVIMPTTMVLAITDPAIIITVPAITDTEFVNFMDDSENLITTTKKVSTKSLQTENMFFFLQFSSQKIETETYNRGKWMEK